MTAIRKIFISYRQSDNRAFVVRIRDWLVNKYGRDNVFMDFDNLPPFVKFEDFIKQRIAESDVILAIIGEGWLQAFADKAAEGEKDYVLIELEEAIAKKKLVAPVLIMNAQMPYRRDVPSAIQLLCDYSAAILRDDRAFYDEMERMIKEIDRIGKFSYAPMRPVKVSIGITKKAEKLVGEGLKYHLRGDLDDALEHYTASIRLNPDCSGYLNRGNVWATIGDIERAIADYDEAIRLAPNDATAFYNKGNMYQRRGELREAIRFWTEAIERDPTHASAYNNRGCARYELGDIVGYTRDIKRSNQLSRSLRGRIRMWNRKLEDLFYRYL